MRLRRYQHLGLSIQRRGFRSAQRNSNSFAGKMHGELSDCAAEQTDTIAIHRASVDEQTHCDDVVTGKRVGYINDQVCPVSLLPQKRRCFSLAY